MRCNPVFVLWAARLVHAAPNLLNRTQAGEFLTDDDSLLVTPPIALLPDENDCPVQCVDYANTDTWTTYSSIDRLRRCNEPVLLQLPETQRLDGPVSPVIRACSDRRTSEDTPSKKQLLPRHNTNNAGFLSGLMSEPACLQAGVEMPETMMLQLDDNGGIQSKDVVAVINLMQRYFADEQNCHERATFSWYNGIVAMTYIGQKLGKLTAESALGALAERIKTNDYAPGRTVAQLCHDGTDAGRVFGVTIDTTEDFEAVQQATELWTKGGCVIDHNIPLVWNLAHVTSWQL
ncbi:hypothetical protein XA68_17278 [Ophiocordyceps unilateralis]|uniref:Uncharacterized protein n=1 Tax=Ophiocordyceps unilateralis TaxID=268505 RepID=A0A2A9PP78_OPHUN|nr:hypothetical protein XA68_17278 [Ophiocordyceps unilateralis]